MQAEKEKVFYLVQEDYNFEFYNFEYDQWQSLLTVTTSYEIAREVYLDDPKHRRIIKMTGVFKTYHTESEINWRNI